MLLINYFRWMRRWRVNWQAENWRDESGEAYQCFIEWHRDRKTRTRDRLVDAVRIAKSRRDIVRMTANLYAKHKAEESAAVLQTSHRVVAAVNAITKAHGVHVTLRRAGENEIEVYVGKNGKHAWTEAFTPEHYVFELSPEVATFNYNTVTRSPEVVSFSWNPRVNEEHTIDYISRAILHGWKRIEDEFQVTQMVKVLTDEERQVLISLANTHYVEFDVMNYNPRRHRILVRMATKGLCDMVNPATTFRANDKTRLVAALSKAEAK